MHECALSDNVIFILFLREREKFIDRTYKQKIIATSPKKQNLPVGEVEKSKSLKQKEQLATDTTNTTTLNNKYKRISFIILFLHEHHIDKSPNQSIKFHIQQKAVP